MKDLYIIQCDKTGDFKVGITGNIENRIRSIQNGCPYTVKVVLLIEQGAYLEKRIHGRLKKFKTTKKNREWLITGGLKNLSSMCSQWTSLSL